MPTRFAAVGILGALVCSCAASEQFDAGSAEGGGTTQLGGGAGKTGGGTSATGGGGGGSSTGGGSVGTGGGAISTGGGTVATGGGKVGTGGGTVGTGGGTVGTGGGAIGTGGGTTSTGGGKTGQDAGCWSTPVSLGNPKTSSSSDIAADPAGNLIAVWLDDEGTSLHQALMYSRYSVATASWSPPLMFADGGIMAVSPRIAINAKGEAAVAWSEDNNDLNWTKWVRFSPDAGWGVPEQVSFTGGRFAKQASIGLDQAGVATVAWQQRQNLSAPVSAWVFRSNSDAGAMRMDQGTGIDTQTMCANAAGDVISVWTEGFPVHVHAARLERDGGWTNAEVSGGLSAISIACGLNAQGDAVVAWTQYYASNSADYEAMAAISHRGQGGWSTPSALSDRQNGSCASISAAIDSTGLPTVSFTQGQGYTYGWLSHFDGVTWVPTRVFLENTLVASTQLVLNESGVGTALWDDAFANSERIDPPYSLAGPAPYSSVSAAAPRAVVTAAGTRWAIFHGTPPGKTSRAMVSHCP